ncbi:MAG: methyltransferase domain-containing protein [Alphaproteobacteria bacterium]|nr:methyltransferase domain-containing protein [Alphaproteobacteria bacterium]
MLLKMIVKSLITDPGQVIRRAYKRTCPICSHSGRFFTTPHHFFTEAVCPSCGSYERHRLFEVFWQETDPFMGKDILHFAPENILRSRLKATAKSYVTADLFMSEVDHKIDVQDIPFDDGAFDIVIANHVLEHIPDDARAMREIHRVLCPGGKAIITVPLIDGYAMTFEDTNVTDGYLRQVFFAQNDHLRYYGSDLPDKLAAAGFTVDVFQIDPRREIDLGCRRGDKIFVCAK